MNCPHEVEILLPLLRIMPGSFYHHHHHYCVCPLYQTVRSGCLTCTYQIVVIFQSLSHVRLFETPWTVAHQASLSFTISRSLLKLTSIEPVMPSNHLILCYPLLFPPPVFPSIRAFSNESALCIRWPKYRSFSFSISPSNEYSELTPSGLTGLTSLQFKGLSGIFSDTTI